MQRILFDQLIQQSEKAAGPILDHHQEGARQLAESPNDASQQKIQVSLKPSIKIQSSDAFFQLQVNLGPSLNFDYDQPNSKTQFKILLSVEQLIQLTQYMEATHKLVVPKLSGDLWHASSKCLSDKVPLMQHLITSVDIYIQSIVKKPEMIQKDHKILNLIGIRNNFENRPYQTPEISVV